MATATLDTCKYQLETERNLDKEDKRKSVNLEKFKRMDFAVAKQSLSTDLVLRAKLLDALSELKTGNYRMCNECIHHTVRCEEEGIEEEVGEEGAFEHKPNNRDVAEPKPTNRAAIEPIYINHPEPKPTNHTAKEPIYINHPVLEPKPTNHAAAEPIYAAIEKKPINKVLISSKRSIYLLRIY